MKDNKRLTWDGAKDAVLVERREKGDSFQSIADALKPSFGCKVHKSSCNNRYKFLKQASAAASDAPQSTALVPIDEFESEIEVDIEHFRKLDATPPTPVVSVEQGERRFTCEPVAIVRGLGAFVVPAGKETISITELRESHCSWPYDNEAGVPDRYCGARRKIGPYCSSHGQTAYYVRA